MGKKKFVYILSAILLFVAVAWCAFRRCSNNEHYLSVLPQDVIALSRIHVDELVKAHEDAPSILTGLFIRNFSNKTGIDYSAPVYAFMDAERKLGLVGAVSDASAMQSFLAKNNFKVTSEEGFYKASWSYLHLVFDEDKFLCIMKPSSSDTDIEGYITAAMLRSEQVPSSLQSAIDTLNSPLAFAAFANALPESVSKPMEVILPKGSSLEDITLTSFLSLRANEIRMEGKISSDNSEINKLLDRMDATFRPVGAYHSLDANLACIASAIHLNVEGKDFLQFARSIPDVRLALLALNMCIDADMMISSVKGPVSIYNMKEPLGNGNTVLSASLDNTDFLRNINNWDDNLTSGSIGYEKISDSEFKIDALEKNFWFRVQDKALYIASHNPTDALYPTMDTPVETTQNRMVIQVKLDGVEKKMIPPLQEYMKPYKSILLQFSDSRHFNIQIQ